MEIIKNVSQRTGISEDQARLAVEGLNDSLRGNLPGPMGDLLGGLLNGTTPSTPGPAAGAQDMGMDDLVGALGGLLGGAPASSNSVGLDDLLGGLMGDSPQAAGGATGNQVGMDDLLSMILGGGTQGGLTRDGLTQNIADRSGISPEIAASVLPIVLEFFDDKLPPQLNAALRSMLSGQPNMGGLAGNDGQIGLDDLARGIGGLLDGR